MFSDQVSFFQWHVNRSYYSVDQPAADGEWIARKKINNEYDSFLLSVFGSSPFPNPIESANTAKMAASLTLFLFFLLFV